MSLTGEVKTLRFLSPYSNTGDIITLQSSVSVELWRVLFSLVVSVLSTWLMPLASQYLLLGLCNVQAYIKMLLRVTC